MKQKTKIIFLLIFIATAAYGTAQTVALKGGLNSSNLSYYVNDNDLSDMYSAQLGFQLGANLNLPLAKNYLLSPSVLFVKRNQEFEGSPEPGDQWNSEPSHWYIELPVLLRRTFAFNKTSLFLEAGPYLGVGISIEEKYKFYENGVLKQEGTYYAEWGSGDNDTKRFDMGFNVGAGLLINKLEIGVSYVHGLLNASNQEFYETKNRAFMLNCAYPLFSFNHKEK
jgi:hypothetical protein